MKMILNNQDKKKYIEEDSKANIGKASCSWLTMKVNVWYGNDRYRFLNYLIALRKYEYAINCLHGPFSKVRLWYSKIRWHRLGAKYNVNIIPNVVSPGIICRHLTGGIIINCQHLGKNCMINTGVLVGNKGAENLAFIGDNVFLGAGCKVIGGVHIGNNVIVAPNSVVVKDIPDNVIVSGIPAKFLKVKE